MLLSPLDTICLLLTCVICCFKNIVNICGVCAWLIRQVLDWMIGFIDTLYTQLGTTGNYSDIADLQILQFTFTHTGVLSLH
jgi:hypothetical protein